MEIVLSEAEENYKIVAEKGIGIQGGIGSINIDFE